MTYRAKGMNAAATGAASCVKTKGPTTRTILRKGRPKSVRLLDSWDMVRPPKVVLMPGPKESPHTPRISRKERVSPLTKIAEKWSSPEWRTETKRLDLHHA
jgi:hypothetical protein